MKIDLKHAWSSVAAFANNNLTLDAGNFVSYANPRSEEERRKIDPDEMGFPNHSLIGSFYTVPIIPKDPPIRPERLERFILSSTAGLTITKAPRHD